MLLALVTMLAAQIDVFDAGSNEPLPAPSASPLTVDAGTPPPPAVTVPDILKDMKFDAGLGKGVSIGNDELELTLRGRIQFLFQSQFPEAGSNHDRFNSFQIRRARLVITTKLPFHLSTYMQLAFSRQDMEPDEPNVLRDYYVEWRRLRDVSVRFGQFKVPFDVQRVVSSSSLQFPDRSVVTQELNMERDIGIALFSEDLFGFGDRLRYTVAVMGGDGRNRIGGNPGLLFIGRVVISPLGRMDDKLEGDPERERRLRFALGAAIARNNDTIRPRSTIGTPLTLGSFDYTHATVDFHIKGWGFSLLAQGFLRDADADFNVSPDGSHREWSRSGLGWFVQGGAFVLNWLELVARYGDLRPYSGTDPRFVRTREIAGGVNFMIEKHNLKLQLDYNWLDDGHFRDGRHLLRAQAQVFF